VWVHIKNSHPKRWRRGWRKNPTWRDDMKAAMRWMVAHEPDIHYAQVRPFSPRKVFDRALPITTDCSGSTTMLYYAVGLPDPNGNQYDGTGYTGTLRANLPHKQFAKLDVGDLIIYGTGNGVHVVAVYEPHATDPLVFSHGQERGPILVRHSAEVATHGTHFTSHGRPT
jgi:hypothetical protein